jgi:hypothetical protein
MAYLLTSGPSLVSDAGAFAALRCAAAALRLVRSASNTLPIHSPRTAMPAKRANNGRRWSELCQSVAELYQSVAEFCQSVAEFCHRIKQQSLHPYIWMHPTTQPPNQTPVKLKQQRGWALHAVMFMFDSCDKTSRCTQHMPIPSCTRSPATPTCRLLLHCL